MKSERGQALVEFALTFGILMVLLFGIIDFGRVFHAYLALDHAGREAARAASIGGTNAEIEDAAKNAARGLDISSGIEIDPAAEADRTSGEYAKITLSYTVDFITPIAHIVSGSSLPLKIETVMRVE